MVEGWWTSVTASMARTSEGWTIVTNTMAPTIKGAPHTAVPTPVILPLAIDAPTIRGSPPTVVHTAVIKPLDIDDRIIGRVMEPFRMALPGLEGHTLDGH